VPGQGSSWADPPDRPVPSACLAVQTDVRSALLDAAAHGHGTLAVDMTATRFCDSSGLHTLLAAHQRAEGEGGELLLVCSATAVLRVFELTALDRIIPTFTSLDQALAHAPRHQAGRPAERMRAASK
jgi:anti-anti-sigma factor